jgi:hypothetical protein
MFVCEYIAGILGVARGDDPNVVKAQIAMIC